MIVRRLIIAVAAAASLSACGAQSMPARLAVNGQPVRVSLYDALVKADQVKVERTGLRIDWQSLTGRQRLNGIQAAVIRQLVRAAVVEQLAKAHGISVSAADLEQGVAAAEQAFGGSTAFAADLEQAGIAKSDFASILRYRMLEARLLKADPASFKTELDAALARAHVVATVGPCDSTHAYPACAAS